MKNKTNVQPFLDQQTETWSYVVYDKKAGHAAVIDAVLNYDAASGYTSTQGAQDIVDFVRQQELQLQWILETHAHADHLSAAPFIKQQLGGKIATGAQITQVQKVFRQVFNLEHELLVDGSQFDYLFADEEQFMLGDLSCKVMATPGHTPACMSWQIGDVVFVGDTLFMPDLGTARCDFPGGDARTMYRSIKKILQLPEDTRLFMCHDYPPEGRKAHQYISTVKQQREENIHVREGISEEEFIAMRTKRDATLAMPRLIIPSIQVNIRAGEMPAAEDNGVVYLKVPINRLGK